MASIDDYSLVFLKDFINEQIGREAVLAAIHQLVFAIDNHRDIWNWGDGYGGWVKNVLIAQLQSVGVSWYPENQEASRDPIKLKVLERDEYTCQNCGKYDEHCHVDHILPRSRGGSNKLDNLQALCASCNSSKGALTMDEWEATGRAAKRRERS